LTADYGGDANYQPASSAGVSHSVNPGASTTTITGHAPDSSVVGEPVSFTVTVTGAGSPPTGTVVVSDGSQSCSITLSGASGSCSIAFDSAGSRSVTATYGGDANYSGSADTVGHTVNPFGAPASLRFTVQPSNTQVLAPITPAVEVSVFDAFGNLVANATDQVTLAIGNDPNGGSTLLGTTTRNASGGVAVFDDLKIDLVGSGFTLVASSGSLTPDTSTAFDITP
jgi:hypothetical protein